MSHWLDDVARQVAEGGVSRRSALRRLGIGAVIGTLATLGRRVRRAEAQVFASRRCLVAAAPNTVYGCPTGETCCPTFSDQGICCPSGTVCTGSATTCGTCPTGSVVCGTGTAATCCNTSTHTCVNGICAPQCSGSAQFCDVGFVCGPTGSGCLCYNTTEGGHLCSSSGSCGAACTTSADCGPGSFCSNTCCGVSCVQLCGTNGAGVQITPAGGRKTTLPGGPPSSGR